MLPWLHRHIAGAYTSPYAYAANRAVCLTVPILVLSYVTEIAPALFWSGQVLTTLISTWYAVRIIRIAYRAGQRDGAYHKKEQILHDLTMTVLAHPDSPRSAQPGSGHRSTRQF